MSPNNFKVQPMNSVMHKSEAETVARNIMVILSRTGNTWRLLPWNEYKAERRNDNNFTMSEQSYFNNVIDYTSSEQAARLFSPVWKEVI